MYILLNRGNAWIDYKMLTNMILWHSMLSFSLSNDI